MTSQLGMALFLGTFVIVFLRTRILYVWQVILIGLWGFYMAQSHLGDPVGNAVSWLVTRFTQ
ncbi:hypothetical protein P3T35_000903 [Kitasatospora sp. GP30]|uniref:hypothetical protein n=1 Tax=Kitasatospora sp. GP30 TaxID=3035084 RepID=UPI000C701259|nr:hypothetical protein [Kitasatospora sp. GP30]MDH6138914.1 hypothetical protein [Kitasatospora sp. GP30]